MNKTFENSEVYINLENMLGHRYNQEFYMKVELTFEETKAFQKSATNSSAKKKRALI